MDNQSTSKTVDYREHLQQVTAIHTETIRRLINNNATPPLEMAAVLEDIANLYLDMSDDIRDFALGRPGVAPRFPTECLEEVSPISARG